LDVSSALVPLKGGAVTTLSLGHAASHVVDLGDHAVILGTDSWHLRMSVVNLTAGAPRVLATEYVVRDAVRDLDGYETPYRLPNTGEGHWLLVETSPITPDQQSRTKVLLPLHVMPAQREIKAECGERRAPILTSAAVYGHRSRD
jgi:hypothetical protein